DGEQLVAVAVLAIAGGGAAPPPFLARALPPPAAEVHPPVRLKDRRPARPAPVEVIAGAQAATPAAGWWVARRRQVLVPEPGAAEPRLPRLGGDGGQLCEGRAAVVLVGAAARVALRRAARCQRVAALAARLDQRSPARLAGFRVGVGFDCELLVAWDRDVGAA